MNPSASADDYLGTSAEEDLHMGNDAKSKSGLGVAAAASVGALTFLSGLPATRAADAPVTGQQQSPSIQAPGTTPQQQAPGKMQPPQQQAPTPIVRPPQQQAPGLPERPAIPKPGQPGQQQSPAQIPKPPQQ